jgi:hypothetical protein
MAVDKIEGLDVKHIEVGVRSNKIIVTITCRDVYDAQVMFDDIGNRLQEEGVATLILRGDKTKVTRT